MSCPEFGERHYEIAGEIGRGAYGTVYKARDINNEGKFVALKEIRVQTSSEEGMPMSTMREIALLNQLANQFEHQNIVKLLDVCHGNRCHREMRLMLVFEHVEQDLAKYLEKVPSPGLGPDRIRDLMQQIVNGVDFLHSNRIVHRDLKPQNILVTDAGQIKIADFGLARVYGFENALTTVVVTLYYRAPEVLLQDVYGTAVDLWSCGCILAELHTRRPIFTGKSEMDQLVSIFNIIGLPPESEWPPNIALLWSSFKPAPKTPWHKLIPGITPLAKNLLEKMLTFNHHNRIQAREALLHDYFTSEDIQDHSMTFSSNIDEPNENLSQSSGIASFDESMDSRDTSASSEEMKDENSGKRSTGLLSIDDLEADEKLDESESEAETPSKIERGEKRKRNDDESRLEHCAVKLAPKLDL